MLYATLIILKKFIANILVNQIMKIFKTGFFKVIKFVIYKNNNMQITRKRSVNQRSIKKNCLVTGVWKNYKSVDFWKKKKKFFHVGNTNIAESTLKNICIYVFQKVILQDFV